MSHLIHPSKSGAIIMVGQNHHTPIMQMMTQLHQAAAQDLAQVLSSATIQPIIVSTPDLTWWSADIPVELVIDNTVEKFHFGRQLMALITQYHLDVVWYFGSSSAPLLTASIINEIKFLLASPKPTLITNNIYSSDWLVFNHAEQALPILQKAERDNSLAWEFREVGGYQVHTLSERYPALKLDLDTPADFALIGQSVDCPPYLKQAIQKFPILQNIPISAVLEVLRREGSHVLLVGRVSPQAWQRLSDVTRCWIRVYSEERGMVASRRLERGEAQSILGVLLTEQGAAQFAQTLAQIADAVIMDSRVLMAHHGELPSSAERFASDLGDLAVIEDEWLRELTEALHSAPIPILLGGHSVVAGGLDLLSRMVR